MTYVFNSNICMYRGIQRSAKAYIRGGNRLFTLYGTPARSSALQSDGNFVIYNSYGAALWSSNTAN